jgi:opacity protein-like surface antigen
MRSILMTGAMAAALLAPVAFADEYPTYQPAQTQSTTVTETKSTVPEDQNLTPTQETTTPSTVIEEHSYTATTNTPPAAPVPAKKKTDPRGVQFVLGGGVEGYAGTLAPRLQAGPTWGVRVAARPTKVIGIELGYSGAVNEINRSNNLFMGPGAGGGADVVRNGGEAVATLGLASTPVQPYLLGGVGMSWYDVRHGDGSMKDDSVGSIPLGGGLRSQVGAFTADARLGYSFLFDNQFAQAPETSVRGATLTNGGRYAATLNLGSTF